MNWLGLESIFGNLGSMPGSLNVSEWPFCAHCHVDFRKFHPMQNMAPHLTGDCANDPLWEEEGIARHWRELEQGIC